jgi:hypothetical protein
MVFRALYAHKPHHDLESFEMSNRKQRKLIMQRKGNKISPPLFIVLAPLLLLLAFGQQSVASVITITCPSFIKAKPSPLSALRDYELMLVIDKSGSMLESDCYNSPIESAPDYLMTNAPFESPLSRWEWCREQTADLTQTTHSVLPDGFEVVLFSKDLRVYNNVGASSIPEIFSRTVPKGATHAAQALHSMFEEYFTRRSALGDHAKPLLLVLITDGCPDNPGALRDAIARATWRMHSPDEITVLLLQIGTDAKADRLLDQLSGPALSADAKFPIVNAIPFAKLKKVGLTHALADAIAQLQPTHSKASDFCKAASPTP